MGGDPGPIPHLINDLDAVENPLSRWPQLYLIDKPKKFHPFAIVFFDLLFHGFFRIHRLSFFLGFTCKFDQFPDSPVTSTIIVATPI